MKYNRYRKTTYLLLSLLILGLAACAGTGADEVAPEPDLDEETAPLDEEAGDELDDTGVDVNANETIDESGDTGSATDMNENGGESNANDMNENTANENADDMNENGDDDDDMNENGDDDNANEANENGDEGNANEGTGDVPAGDANVVEVTEAEWVINMPASLPAGPTTFEVSNIGAVAHNFEIEGQGVEQELEEDLQPGESSSMQVDLQPGTYTVYCPISGHDELGMELQLEVTE